MWVELVEGIINDVNGSELLIVDDQYVIYVSSIENDMSGV
jgi:hypothetical protein